MGCDSSSSTHAVFSAIFQSTHPSGVRPVTPIVAGVAVEISIHAPQWGATRVGDTPVVHVNRFQSTHPSGVRRPLLLNFTLPPIFQSTHPSGVRPPVRVVGENSVHFNPRTPVGCDHHGFARRATPLDFNPRTPVGCDPRPWATNNIHPRISNHAPQWGATYAVASALSCSNDFNPRTPVGCD